MNYSENVNTVFALRNDMPGGAFCGTGLVDFAEWNSRAPRLLGLDKLQGIAYDEERVREGFALCAQVLGRAGYEADFLADIPLNHSETTTPGQEPEDLEEGIDSFDALEKTVGGQVKGLMEACDDLREACGEPLEEVRAFRILLDSAEGTDITFKPEEVKAALQTAEDTIEALAFELMRLKDRIGEEQEAMQTTWDRSHPSVWYAEGVWDKR